jgi:pimeloyl-ACP methyl ester carboxylesterase
MVKMLDASESELAQEVNQASFDDIEMMFGAHAEQVKLYAAADPAPRQRGDSLLVLLPGLTGSALKNNLNDEIIWLNPAAFLQGRLNHLNLKPDGLTDATPGVSISAPNPLWFVYAKMVLRLRYEFDLRVFPFDWRKGVEVHALKLAEAIEKSLKVSRFDQVTLVGHSMGGLVIMDYLLNPRTRARAEQVVKRAITLGAPFRGTMDALVALSRPNDPRTRALSLVNRRNNLHKMLLTTPGLYQVLPAPNNLYPDWTPVPDVDIYDPRAWQAIDVEINRDHLAAAKKHHQMLARGDPQVRLINVVGAYYRTPVRLLGDMLSAMPRARRQGWDGGDGTVQVHSAIYRGAEAYYLQEQHIELALDDDVIRSVMAWADGGDPVGLVSDVQHVPLIDRPLRAAAQDSGVSQEVIAEKIQDDEALNHDEIMSITNVLGSEVEMVNED